MAINGGFVGGVGFARTWRTLDARLVGGAGGVAPAISTVTPCSPPSFSRMPAASNSSCVPLISVITIRMGGL